MGYSDNLNDIRKDGDHDSSLNVHFDLLEEKLVQHISRSKYVIGCVAWLTNSNIIDALKKISGVKIIINKEEYLSSKMDKSKMPFYKELRKKYDSIPVLPSGAKLCGEYFLPFFLEGAILTFGIVNVCPKMHHKFLVFFDENYNATGVWSGSYNLSENSNNSIENALYITDSHIITEYIKEFICIYKRSEEYDWKCGYLKKSSCDIR